MRKNVVTASLLLASVLATGFVVVCGQFGLWAVEVGRYVTGDDDKNESLFIPPDGNVLVQASFGRRGDVRFRDLDGQACPPPANEACPCILPRESTTRCLSWTNAAVCSGDIPWLLQAFI